MEKVQKLLIDRKEHVLEKWFNSILETYPPDAAKFLKNKKDTFQNPVGQTISKEIEVIFDEFLFGMDLNRLSSSLDNIIRIRAIQNFKPSQAISFVPLLKDIVREELFKIFEKDQIWKDFLELEARIDNIYGIAFDIYAQCREKVFEIRLKEFKKWSQPFMSNIDTLQKEQESREQKDESK